MNMSMYQVKAGQTPMEIAAMFTGDPARVGELVRANPSKPATMHGGVLTFQSLHVGEWLHLPANWNARGLSGGGLITMPMAGGSQVFGTMRGLGLSPGQSYGEAMLVDAKYAEDAGDNWTPDASVRSTDVFALVTPNDVLPASGSVFYVQFKDPPNAQLWKFANQTYFRAGTVDQSKLVPQSQLQGGKPAPPAKVVGAQTGTNTWLIVGIGVAALALGAGAAYYVTRKPKAPHEIAKELGYYR
jgi:hypothetical protein